MARRLDSSEEPPELRKGSGRPVMGMTPMVMPIIDKHVEGQHRGQADSRQAVKDIVGRRCDVQRPIDEKKEQAQHDQGHNKPSLLPNDREDEISMSRRQELVLGLCAFQKAFARQSAGADGDLGLDDIPPGSEGIALRIEEGHNASLLVWMQEVLQKSTP